MGWHLPETEELLPLLKARFSPEEAVFFTGMPLGLTRLEDIAEAKGMDPSELGEKLDALARKQVVYRRVVEDGVMYKLNDAFFTFLRSSYWSGREDETTRALAPITNKYYLNGFFDDWVDTHHRGLRTLPIEETIADTRQVVSYEDVVKLAETLDYPTVSYCPCKQRKNLDPDTPNCEHPGEVCLHFGDLGRYIVQNGMGREITREEMREILRYGGEVRAGARRLELAERHGYHLQLLQVLLHVVRGLSRAPSVGEPVALQLPGPRRPREVQGLWAVRRALPDGGAAAGGVAGSQQQARQDLRDDARAVYRLRCLRVHVSGGSADSGTPRDHRGPAQGRLRIRQALLQRPSSGPRTPGEGEGRGRGGERRRTRELGTMEPGRRSR